MNNAPIFRGAYSRRRYSSYSSTNGGGGGNTYTLEAYAVDPLMGYVEVTQTTLPVVYADDAANKQQQQQSPLKGGSGYPENTIVMVKAVPYDGFRFVSWNHNLPAGTPRQNNPQRVVMNKNVVMSANFERVNINYTLRVNWNDEMGRVTASGSGMQGEMSVQVGSQVSLSATPKAGFRFVRWDGIQLAGNVQNNESQNITITMPTRNLTISAVFAKIDGGGNEGPSDDGGEIPGGGGTSGGSGGTSGGGVGTSGVGGGTQGTDPVSSGGIIEKVKPFVKKWWWAIAIAAYIIYKERKGGAK